MAVGSLAGNVRVFNLDGTESRPSWTVPNPELFDLAFDSTGQQLLWTANQNEVNFRNRSDQTSQVLFSASGPITGSAVDRTRRKLVTAGDKLRIWDHWTDRAGPREIDLQIGSSHALSWSPDGQRLALAGHGLSLQIWDERTQTSRVLFTENTRIDALGWDAAGTRLATGSEDGSLRIWSHDGRFVEARQAHNGLIEALQWSRDGKRIATACSWPLSGKTSDKSVRIWSPDKFDPSVQFPLNELSTGTSAIHAVAWTTDGEHVIFGQGGEVSGHHRIRMFNARTGLHERDFPGVEGDVFAIACHPDGQHVAAGGADKRILIWDLSSPDLPRSVSNGLTGPVMSLAWSSTGNRLAYSCKESGESVGVLDFKTLEALWRARPHYRPGQIAWSPDDTYLMVGLMGVYSADTGARIETLPIPLNATVVGWGRSGLIAGNNYLSNTISVIDPLREGQGWLAIYTGQDVASFTREGALIDSTDDAAAQLRVLSESEAGVVRLEGFDKYPLRDPKPDNGGSIRPTTVMATATVVDADRVAAEWVLSLVSSSPPSVRLRLRENGFVQVVTQGEPLPNKPFRVIGVRVWSAEAVTDDTISRVLAPLRELRSLEVDFCYALTEESAATIQRFRKLTHLGLSATRIRESDCVEVFSALPSVSSVIIHADQFHRKMADFMRGSPQIVRFGIHSANDAQVRQLLSASQLVQLLLFSNSQAETATWHELPDRLTKLEELAIIESHLTDADLTEIARCPKLQRLDFHSTLITDKGLLELQKCPTLIGLDATKTKVTESGVRSLHELHPKCRIIWDGGVMEPTP